MDLSLRIAKVLNEPIEKIFYFKPIINDLIGSLPGNEIIEMSENIKIDRDRLMNLIKLTDDKILSDKYTLEELIKITEALGYEFEELFIKE